MTERICCASLTAGSGTRRRSIAVSLLEQAASGTTTISTAAAARCRNKATLFKISHRDGSSQEEGHDRSLLRLASELGCDRLGPAAWETATACQ
jgi:hypothetical protein